MEIEREREHVVYYSIDQLHRHLEEEKITMSNIAFPQRVLAPSETFLLRVLRGVSRFDNSGGGSPLLSMKYK